MLQENSVINIDDSEPVSFKAFLSSMYGRIVEDESVLWKVLLLAHEYEFEAIKEEGELGLRSLVHFWNCRHMLKDAKKLYSIVPRLLNTAKL